MSKRSTRINMNRQQYIEAHKQQFWYTPESEKQNISDSLLIETMLNYGTLDDIRELLVVLSPRRVAEVFFSASERQIKNYYPEVRHFFTLVLRKYASRNTESATTGTTGTHVDL